MSNKGFSVLNRMSVAYFPAGLLHVIVRYHIHRNKIMCDLLLGAVQLKGGGLGVKGCVLQSNQSNLKKRYDRGLKSSKKALRYC